MVAASVALEPAIGDLLVDVGDPERLAEIGRLGTRLVLQRAVEEEVTAFLGRALYEWTAEARGSQERQPTSAGADRGRRAGDPDATAARLAQRGSSAG